MNLRRVRDFVSLMMLYIAAVAVFLFRWLTSTASGILTLSVLLYISAPRLDWSEPLGFGELIVWFADLPDGYRIALSSSMLTIIGFLIAFQTATKNWQDQLRANAELNAANDIQAFFNEAARNLTKVNIFCSLLVESKKIVSDSTDPARAAFQIDFVNSQVNEFLVTRDRLTNMSVEVHNFTGRYSTLLVSKWGTQKNLDRAVDAFSETAATIWFQFPVTDSESVGSLDVFVNSIDTNQCTSFIDMYEKNFDVISSMSGMVSGNLSSAIFIPNLSSLWTILSYMPELQELLNLRKKNAIEEPTRTSGD